MKTEVPAMIRGYVLDGDVLHLEIVAEKPGNLVLRPNLAVKSVIARIKGETAVFGGKDEIVIPFR